MPTPLIVARQTATNWILQYVRYLLIQALGGSQHVIEGFFLPDCGLTIEAAVDGMRRCAFDSLHDFS